MKGIAESNSKNGWRRKFCPFDVGHAVKNVSRSHTLLSADGSLSRSSSLLSGLQEPPVLQWNRDSFSLNGCIWLSLSPNSGAFFNRIHIRLQLKVIDQTSGPTHASRKKQLFDFCWVCFFVVYIT